MRAARIALLIIDIGAAMVRNILLGTSRCPSLPDRSCRLRRIRTGVAACERGLHLAAAGIAAGLMPEMPHAREHHGDAMLVRSLDDFLVAHRAAGLDHGCGAGFDAGQHAVGEREERI
jgi:hypothetical protein